MSNVQTGAEREFTDLTHFVYSCGSIGRLKVLDTVPVLPGDSFELDVVGAFRLSPFRRGLSVDVCVDVFSFYVPHRHTYGTEFVELMKTGIPKGGALSPVLSTDAVDSTLTNMPPEQFSSFLGTHYNLTSKALPRYYYQSYLRIFNNYFKNPYEPDVSGPMSIHDSLILKDGFPCAHLESSWSKPLNPNLDTEFNIGIDPVDGLNIMGLDGAYAHLHTQQERDLFMQRYRDVVTAFGGKTHYDVDLRPRLIMHDTFWGSGYDTDGTTQETLGQYSGRVQQPFVYQVPRFFVPEHGVIMTLMLARFPPTHMKEMHTLASVGALDYGLIACDPALVANSIALDFTPSMQFESGDTSYHYKVPHSHWYRYHPSYVDFRYRELQGFPFLQNPPDNDLTHTKVISQFYDHCFQTTQLGHWNVQTKFNCNVYRRIPTTRDSVMTS